MALLAIEDIHLRFDERPLLRGVSLVVEEGERIGLVGPNGCGKSTLLSILAGRLEPDDGKRTLRRGLRLGWLEQDPQLPQGATVHEAVASGLEGRAEVLGALDRVHARLAAADLGAEEMERLLEEQQHLDERLEALGGHDVDHRIDAMLADLGLDRPDALCDQLSGGQRRRTALARLLLSRPDLVLLDEPTNHLDAQVIAWLERFLIEQKQPLVMVTHDRYFLDRVVDRIVEIDRGEAHAYEGGYQDFVLQRAARLEREAREERTRQNLMRREIAWMRRGPPARTTKSKSRLQRAHDLIDDAPEEQGADLEFRIPPGPRLGNRVVELSGVSKSYGALRVIEDLTLELRPGERVGIIGPNGAGKSTFLGLCMGTLTPDAGEVEVGPTVRFAAIDQSRSDLDPHKTVVEEVGGGNDYVALGDGQKVRVETFLEQFLFPGPMKQAKVGSLSGGERNRVLLAKLLSQGGNVLVLDEPTNDLDLASLRTLEEALIDFPGAVLCVSHDRWFLDRVATRVLLFDGSGSVRVHEGDLSLLLDRLEQEEDARRRAERAEADRAREKAKVAAEQEAAAAARAPRKLGSRERKELEELPARIEAGEARLEEIDAELGDPALYGRSDAQQRLDALQAERAKLQQDVARFYTRWEELDAMV
jgi:ATP-binding cassette subfamily F protein uup